MQLKNIFTDRGFRFSTSRFKPNRQFYNGQIGGIVVVQSRQDFALSAPGLKYLAEAEAAGTITEGFVVLARMNNDGTPEYVAEAPAKEVYERLKNLKPREGKWGWDPYYWITVTFQPSDDGGVLF